MESVSFAITAISHGGQRAGDTLKVAGAEIVEHQASFFEVSSSQFFLDTFLPLEQPIHGGIEIILVGIGHTEAFGQCGGVPPPCRREFAVRFEDACGNHRLDQVALTAWLRSEQFVETKASHRRTTGVDVAVKRGLDDLKCFADSDEGLTFESAAYELDDIFGQV